MRRGSLIGPMLLIAIGGLFLIHNLWPELPVLSTITDWWPFVLIGWGAIRLIEITKWKADGRPLPQNGISGGEWTFIVFLCVAGSAIFTANKYRDRWPARINVGGLEMLGESYDYPQAQQAVPGVGKTPRVLIENLRGNARIVGADAEEVRASGRLSVRSFQRADADKVGQDCKLEVVRQGDLIVVRTNQDRASNSTKVTAELEITVPRGATVETRGRYGDWEIADINGAINVDSENAGVRINNAGGAVKVATRASDVVRVVNAKSTVELTGRGEDVELDNIAGLVTINGSYRGELTFRNLAKPVRVDDPRGELRCERIPGSVTMSRGEFNGSDVVGPIVIRGQSKDVELSNFSETLEVSVERGDLDIRPGRVPLAKIDVRTRAGNVTLSLPEAAKFSLEATTDRGEIDNEFGDALKLDSSGKGAKLEGTVGAGPALRVSTGRGQVTIGKGTLAPPDPPAAPRAPAAPTAPAATVAPRVQTL